MTDAQQPAAEILRMSPLLAAEIGVNESIVLMQLQYLNEISEIEREGVKWAFNTLDVLVKKYFPFISKPTLSRVLKNLASQGLIKIGNFNKYGFDHTQWFHVDLEKCAKLPGFIKFQNETSKFQNETWMLSKRNLDDKELKLGCDQNETTIQETQEEIQEEIQKKNLAPAVAGRKNGGQNSGKPKEPRPPDLLFEKLAAICGMDLSDLTDKQRGKLNQVAKHFREKYGGKPDSALVAGLEAFAVWWRKEDWRGRQNQPPDPYQVQENWKRFRDWFKANDVTTANDYGQTRARA